LRRKHAGLEPLANSHKSWQPRVRLRAAGLTPSPQLPRSGSPSRKRRTEDGIVVSCSTVTPDCQELDWHDTRADTRPRDQQRVHPTLQCLPTRTQAPSIAARRPAAQPRSAPLTGRDGQAGPALCPSCAWCPAPRPRPRSVCHVVVVGLVQRRLLFAKDLISKVGGVDSKDSSELVCSRLLATQTRTSARDPVVSARGVRSELAEGGSSGPLWYVGGLSTASPRRLRPVSPAEFALFQWPTTGFLEPGLENLLFGDKN